MDYYELSYSTDLNLTGHIPQVNNAEIIGQPISAVDAITYFKHPHAESVFKGRKKLDANFTDLMTCAGLSVGKGLLVSEKLYVCVKQFELPDCAVYPFQVHDAEHGTETEYKYLHIIACETLKNSINYARSSFYFQNKSGERGQIKVKDWNDWWDNNLKRVEKGENPIIAESIQLKIPTDKLPGLLRLPFSAIILVSESLKAILEKNKLTGLSFDSKVVEILAA